MCGASNGEGERKEDPKTGDGVWDYAVSKEATAPQTWGTVPDPPWNQHSHSLGWPQAKTLQT